MTVGRPTHLLLNHPDELLQHVAAALVHDHRRRQVPQQVLRIGLQRVEIPAAATRALASHVACDEHTPSCLFLFRELAWLPRIKQHSARGA